MMPRYQITLDRAGLALAAGGVLYGVLAMLLAARDGGPGALLLIEILAIATLLAMLAITATFGPLWLALHASGRRGPGYAAALGAIVALMLWIAAAHDLLASYAFADQGSAAIGWLRAIGVALMFAATAAATALVMWRVAYRRVG
ncbi:hypothetical protein ACFO8O_12455 [Hephaestia sp. GCM10023244]|uniref:hypothetical protein n=1 Tax=unclassified Hephaestia TaxID=2631281 RepID=UPI002077072D|nr:hypothetical protein [Hephaestia sp. MAHUQ-44]MCM8731772.1 hypothetical protein [Hephaestia sp. MAHUQ-44]